MASSACQADTNYAVLLSSRCIKWKKDAFLNNSEVSSLYMKWGRPISQVGDSDVSEEGTTARKAWPKVRPKVRLKTHNSLLANEKRRRPAVIPV